MQLLEVRRTALREVLVGLRRDTGRRRRTLHEGRVGLLLTAEDDDGTAGGGVRRETTAQILRAAEQADDDDVGALGGVAVRRDAPRVGDGVVGAARASAEQVGVGGRDEGDARHEGSSFAGVHARVVMRGLPWHGSRSSGRS